MISNMELDRYGYDNESINAWKNFINKSHYSDDKLDASIFHNIILIPDTGTGVGAFNGGGFDRNGNPVEAFFQRKGILTANILYKRGFKETSKVVRDTVIYLGQLRNHWGNFLFDSITRLWYIKNHPECKKFVFLLTNIEAGEVHKNILHFLELYGVAIENIIFVKEPMWFDNIIVPDLSLKPFTTWHKEYFETIRTVVNNSNQYDDLKFEKVYFSRAKFAKKYKSDFGNEIIKDFFKINGFKIIYPEEHTLEEQISIISNCKIFASVCGAGAHNVIFSSVPPKTILIKRMNGYQEHQWFFNEIAKVEPVTYIDAYNEPYKKIYTTTMGGPYLFMINKNVRLFAQDNSLSLPHHWRIRNSLAFAKYTLACLRSSASRIKKRIIHK